MISLIIQRNAPASQSRRFDSCQRTYKFNFSELLGKRPHIDFVHEKRHMDVGGYGEVGACDVSR